MVVTSDGLAITSSPIQIDPSLSTSPTVVISGNQNVYYNASQTNDGNSDTLTATIKEGTTALTSSDYSSLSVT